MLDRQLLRDLLRRTSAVPTLAGDGVLPAPELAAGDQSVEPRVRPRAPSRPAERRTG
ncbi:hypothetical protein RB614_00805 [Phytohabitans sp. ZYX-F-186]|uniref:Uncharacterized protein n=2 Tax=Phytohabitans maris TaxID=3071409 RepID=A0ABU0Z7M8_9ACTN|nr:hypothetical protein [Phytohabitans sp. ZYX-F-186]